MGRIEITGLRSGRLVAIEPAESDAHGRILWRCACDCGGEALVVGTVLRQGRRVSCGCLGAGIVRGCSVSPIRFMSHTVPNGECLDWALRVDDHGYGCCFDTKARRPFRAHRVAWALAHGGIMPELCVMHRCDNRRCVRTSPSPSYPDGHLCLGTHRDNSLDMRLKGRGRGAANIGAQNPNAKLTADDVRRIRARLAAGETQVSIGMEFGLRQGAISDIANGVTWKSVA